MKKQDLFEGAAVKSTKGHDTGKLFVVISVVNEDFVLIADGKSRTIEKPKLKRKKHLINLTNAENSTINIEKVTDKKIIEFLKKF